MLEYIPYIFNSNEIIDSFSNKRQMENYLQTRIKNGTIARVKGGLYVSLDSLKMPVVNKFQIASRLFEDSYIASRSALEYYGYSNQVYNDVIVGSSHRFRELSFMDNDYVPLANKNNIQIEYNEMALVRVSSIERAIVDCIKNISLAGGIDEVLNALDMMGRISGKKILEVLASYNEFSLYQKCGYILEHFKDNLDLNEDFFDECSRNIGTKTNYFLKDEYNDIIYYKKWRLMAPANLLSIINGGY